MNRGGVIQFRRQGNVRQEQAAELGDGPGKIAIQLVALWPLMVPVGEWSNDTALPLPACRIAPSLRFS